MARILRKVRISLFRLTRYTNSAVGKCLLLIFLVVFVKVAIVLPILIFIRHDTSFSFFDSIDSGKQGHTKVANGETLTRDSARLPRKPDNRKLRQIYRYLDITEEEVESNLPLTLKSALTLSRNHCEEDEESKGANSIVDALFMVHTAPTNIQRRLRMRNTIFNEKYFRPFKVKVVFLMGRVTDDHLQKGLEYEHSQYGDLLQGDFIDSYRNLSHKGVMGFRWMSEHCAGARHVIKMDDDVFFDMFKFLTRYRILFSSSSRAIFCNVLPKDSMIIHRQDNRWTVDDGQFAGLDTYPFDYCSGFAVVMSGDLVPQLYQAASFTPVFWIDDVYLFGMLPKVVGKVSILDLGYKQKYMNLQTEEVIKCMRTSRQECSVLATLCYSTEDWETLWNITYHVHVDTDYRLPFINVD